MSVKPLDLQVNINSLHNLTRQEGDRISRDAANRREMNQSVIDETKAEHRKVAEAGTSEQSTGMKEYNEHSAKTRVEQEAEELRDQNRKNKNKKREHPRSELSSSDKKGDEKRSEEDLTHHYDFLA